MRSRKWYIERAPWTYPEQGWITFPTTSEVPQCASKTNFKAFGYHVYGDMDLMRLVLSLGRILALT